MQVTGRKVVFALVMSGWVAVAASSVQTSARQTQAAAAVREPAVQATLDRYCITCHNQRLRTGGLVLEGVDAASPAARADIWERVIAKLRARSMPPAGLPRPDAAPTMPSPHRSRETSIARGRPARTRAGSARCIASIASNMRTRSAICSRSMSMSRRSCRETRQQTAASITLPTSSRFRPRTSNDTCRWRVR